MKPILSKAGKIVFWLGWPGWFVYFKLVSNRSRVFVVSEGKILLVKTWLSDESWGLPGGGAHRNEPMELSAVRELYEEVGISARRNDLKSLGDYPHRKHGLKFQAYFFLLELDKLPAIKKQKGEIAEAGWFTKSDIKKLRINADTRYGLTEYNKQIQA